MRGHDNLFACIDILSAPKASDRFLLGVEHQSRLSIKCACTPSCDALLIPREGEHGKWDREWDIDADLSSFDIFLEI